MEKIKFVPLTFGSDTKTYVRADTIVRLSEDGDLTSVYTSNSDVPIKVKESVGEILAKIRGTAWEQALTDRIEPGTDGYAYKMTISNGKEFEKRNCDDAVSRKEVFETFGELLGTWGTQALMEMPSVTPTRKWISCSERLPEEANIYLVTINDKEYGKRVEAIWYNGEKLGWDFRITDDVIAWLPLPEPYNAESEAENDNR